MVIYQYIIKNKKQRVLYLLLQHTAAGTDNSTNKQSSTRVGTTDRTVVLLSLSVVDTEIEKQTTEYNTIDSSHWNFKKEISML